MLRAFRTIVPGLALLALLCAPSVRASDTYEETEKKHSWISFTRPAEKTPEAQFERAEKFRAQGSLKAAQKAYRALVVTWPRAAQAAVAQQRYAELLLALDNPEDAFEAYETLIDRYTGQFDYTEVIKQQFELGQKVMARRKGRFLFFGGFKAPERAIPMFEAVIRHAPRSEFAAEAQYLIGSCHELADELEMAVVAYMNTQHRHPDSAFAEKAAFGRAHCLYLLAEESPNDDEALEQAWAGVTAFLNAFPDSDRADTSRLYQRSLLRRRAEIAYQRGVFYDRVAHQPKAALMSYENFVKMFPNSDWTETARARIEALRPIVEKAKKP